MYTTVTGNLYLSTHENSLIKSKQYRIMNKCMVTNAATIPKQDEL